LSKYCQNMSKNAYILEKSCKIAAVLRGPPPSLGWPLADGDYVPRPQSCYFHLLI